MRSCPRCTWPLSAFTHQGVELDHCRRCGGTFLDPGDATSLFGQAAEPQYWRDEHNAHSYGESKLSCPTGHAMLEIFQVAFATQRVEVDVCPRCHGLWIDHDEGVKLYNIVAAARAHADRKESGIDRPGVPSYVFQLLTFFPMEVWNPVKHRPIVVYTIMSILLTVFVLQLVFAGAIPPEQYGVLLMKLALVPANPTPYSFLTYGLLHGSPLHIFGNLYFLWIFGDNVEDALGPRRFILLYLVSNIAGGALYYLFHLDSMIPMLGASGAVFGLMGAYLILFPRVKLWLVLVVRLRLSAIWYIAFYVAFNVVMALRDEAGTAWYAHLGGFAAGVAMALLYRNSLRIRIKRSV